MRSAFTVLWLSWRRLARRGGTVALAGAGIAAGTAVVFGVLGGSTGTAFVCATHDPLVIESADEVLALAFI